MFLKYFFKSMSIMLSIPELAGKKIDEILSETKVDNSRSIFIAGSKSVGKSTLLHTFLEKTDAPKESLVLEYSFGRKSKQKQSLEKTICHMWEYGGKLPLLKEVLTSVPRRGPYTFMVMVDLSNIKSIWTTLETCLQAFNDLDLNGKSNEAKPNLIIIGGKYDLFKNYDSEIKKLICTTLRGVALLHFAHLFFYSSKDPALVRRMKEFLHYFCFGSGTIPKDKSTSLSKPLLIPNNSDSWESIGMSPVSMEQIKTRYVSLVPPEMLVSTTEERKGKRAQAEPSLDSLLASRYEELRHIDGPEMATGHYLDSLC